MKEYYAEGFLDGAVHPKFPIKSHSFQTLKEAEKKGDEEVRQQIVEVTNQQNIGVWFIWIRIMEKDLETEECFEKRRYQYTDSLSVPKL